MPIELPIETRPLPVPKVHGRGRKGGTGVNLDLLRKMKSGQSIWEVPKAKMESIRSTATIFEITIKVRRLPDSDNYVIFKA